MKPWMVIAGIIVLLPLVTNIAKAFYNEEKIKKHFARQKEILKGIVNEKNVEMPYFSDIFADYLYLCDIQDANYLERKSHPSIKGAEKVREIAKEKREIEKKYRMLKYQLAIYEKVAPWLEEFKEIDINDLKNKKAKETDYNDYQIVKELLSPSEYKRLSVTEKYQKALERYMNRANKTNWQIGRDYERYIGYKYEKEGYKVQYFGATEGLNDLGRDIIAEKGEDIIVIQCKYWNKKKIIHEKHIFQLFGTMFAIDLEKKHKTVSGIFITSAKLSEIAKLYAEKLNIVVQENIAFNKDYPCVKCNINRHTGEKIYHLPFDQQYDKIVIDYSRGECYVSTVAEAENLGFRRAYRWQGNTNERKQA